MAVAMVMLLSMLTIVVIMGVMALQEIDGRYSDEKLIRSMKDTKPTQISILKSDDLYAFLDINFNEIIAFGDDLMKFKAPVVGEQEVKRSLVYGSFRRASSAIYTGLSSINNRLTDLGFVSPDSGGSTLSRQALVKDFSEKYRCLYKV